MKCENCNVADADPGCFATATYKDGTEKRFELCPDCSERIEAELDAADSGFDKVVLN